MKIFKPSRPIAYFSTRLTTVALCLISSPTYAQTALNPQAVPLPNVQSTNFIPPQYMISPYHNVAPQAVSNGLSNLYTIDTPYGEHVVEGTERALERIAEIKATEILRQKSTIGAVVNSAKNRTVNLVETPIRIVNIVGDEIDTIGSVEDALFFIPYQAGNILDLVGKGVSEIGRTGARIVTGVSGTKCKGLNCVQKTGEDIWSGLNSIAGKHNSARKLHQALGTDPETDNKALKRQINRLAYADAYAGTAYKIGLGTGYANINHFSEVVTGVGYVNNAEFITSYEDAHKIRKRNKTALAAWGIPAKAITDFYSNPTYTKSMRARIITAFKMLKDKKFAGGPSDASSDGPYTLSGAISSGSL